jgi:PBSX family phage terminase large subunit
MQPTSPSERRIILRGGNADIFNDTTSSECVVVGSAGTGKSVSCMSKLHHYCSTYPNVRALMCRKTRKSISESGLVTFESIAGDYRKYFSREKRTQRSSYDYPNGSTLVIGGLDDPVKIMSTDFDLCYVQESVELHETDWQSLTTRLRNGKLPFQQIFGDTNPSYPTHWLKQRCDRNQTKLYQSIHEDNPAYFNADGSMTLSGVAYIAKLDALTGAIKDRLRWGKWVQAEGVVYDIWNPAIHLIDPFPIPASWPRYVGVDFGFNDPAAVLWLAADEDKRLFLYREFYQTGRTSDELGRLIRAYSKTEPPPQWIVCDHAAESRHLLDTAMGRSSVPANKKPGSVNAGVELVKRRLAVAGDGRPRLLILKNSLLFRDKELYEVRKKPTSIVQEFDSYTWRDIDKKDEPEDDNNHSLDACRYIIDKYDMRPTFNMEVQFIG